ncbi:type VII secretion integral membrane protein EccD [Mycolicibacterium sp. Y3]
MRGFTAVEDSLCRVAVAWSGEMTDLVLPRSVPLAALLPEVVDLVAGSGVRTENARTWRLHRVPEGPLDESMTLQECGIQDGDILTMSGVSAPAFLPSARGDFRTVISAGAPRHEARAPEAWAWCVTIAVTTLMYTLTGNGHPAAAAAVAAFIAGLSAVVARRAPGARTAACTVAVVFSAAAGHLATGAALHAPGVLLGSAAAALTSVVLGRLSACGTALLTAYATYAFLLAVATALAVITPVGVIVIAAILVVTALAGVGTAARLTIALTGLAPVIPDHGDSRITDRRAGYAGEVLAGIVSGGAAAAATGSVLMAVGCARAGTEPSAGPLLVAVVAGALFLRSRLYADSSCRIALVTGGLISATAASAILLMTVPAQAGWIAVTTVGVTGGLYAQRHTFGPVWVRGVDVLEHALLVAAVPLAGWAAGVFGIARHMDLPW